MVDSSPPSSDQAFYDHIRKLPFGGVMSQSQVDGIDTILAEWRKSGSGIDEQLAYVLATVHHETAATMQPITEYGSESYLKAKPYWPYVGRGYIQLTWRSNYAKADEKLGLGNELVVNPDKALDHNIAAQVLVHGMRDGWFAGKKLSDYITPTKCDFFNARRVVNGTDRAQMIANSAKNFLAALTS